MFYVRRSAASALLVFALAACSLAQEPEHKAGVEELTAALQALIDSVAADPTIPGALLYAESPRLGLEWSGAAGVTDVATGAALPAVAPVRIASNTKTYVAAAVLRLWESGRLGLDDAVVDYLTESQAATLRGDGYDLNSITIRLLLTHSAGLFDHADTDEYMAALTADPGRRWTPADQLQGAVDWGDPLWTAGQAYSYSDTGYVLLGLVIERVTGQTLGSAVRSLLDLDAAGFRSTWWEIVEVAPPAGELRAHQYIGGVDTYNWDASLDLYGGGGLVTSMADLGRFWRRLFERDVFENSETLDTMMTSPLPAEESTYRMGMFVEDYDGLVGYAHGGFWGTQVVYIPELDLVVAAAVTERGDDALEAVRLVTEAVAVVRAAR